MDSSPEDLESILDGMDSYWEDIASPLIVSRMVNDSIIKGIVSATEESAAEKIKSLESEVSILMNLIRDIGVEFKTKLSERHAINSKILVKEISILRRDLEMLILSECGSERRKDNSPEFVVPVMNESLLMMMSKEELISYFKAEMAKIKRQHDQALQEKTEELFSVKRELYKGSTSLSFRKEKDIDLVRKPVSDLMAKLDVFLENNDKIPILNVDQELSSCLKERIDTFCMSSSLDANLVNEIEKLQFAVEEEKMGSDVREYVYVTMLNEFAKEVVRHDSIELERKFVEDTYSFIYEASVGDALTGMSSLVNSLLLEKEKTLCSEIEENAKLKEEMTYLSTLLKEKEKLALDANFELAQQKEQHDVVSHELVRYKDKMNEQERVISSTKKDFDLLSFKLEETIQRIQQREVEISDLKQKFNIVSTALEEAERQKNNICRDSREKEEKLLMSGITKDKEQKERLTAILFSTLELSKAIENCENRLAERMGNNESRIKMLSYQCNQLIQLASKQVFWYKQRFERRCQDLQKAEAEVDLLGDEVDVLLSLLEKIYMALDHYSPVLQHYPGVMETLRLIEKEMKGENGKNA